MSNLITNIEVTDLINDNNFDKLLINDNYVSMAEQKHLVNLLGQRLYVDVMNNQTTYATLLDGGNYTYSSYTYNFIGVKKFLAWASLFEAISFVQTKIKSKGIMHESGEFSNNVDSKEADRIRNICFLNMQSIAQQITDYLQRNTSTYTLYYDSENAYSTIGIYGGIIFKNNKTTKKEDENY